MNSALAILYYPIIIIIGLIMASGLGLLKTLACPAGNKCTAFHCLFKHEGDAAQEPPPAAEQRPAQKTPAPEGSLDEDRPHKRPKVSTGPSSTEPGAAASGLHRSNVTESRQASVKGHQGEKTAQVQSSNMAAATSLQPAKIKTSATIQRGASKLPEQSTKPPEQSTKLPEKSTKRKGPDGPLASAESSASLPRPDQAAPKKPETLNPRHLQKAPAGHDMRLKLLKLLHEQFVRLNNEMRKEPKDAALVLSDQDLITKSLDYEQDMALTKYNVYGNALKLRISAYKRMQLADWRKERVEATKKDAGKIVESEAPEAVETGLSPAQEVDFLRRLSVPLSGLERYGYVSTVPREEDISKAKNAVEDSGHYEACDRCARRFAVFPGRREEDGALTTNGPCVYHPGRTYFTARLPVDVGPSQKRYKCCNQTVGETPGCATGDHHVYKTTDPNRLGSVLNFAETPDNPSAPKDRAVCFDCEMGYTVHGLELIRLTAVSFPAGEVLLDILVWPVGEYLDLNTRYSGVRPEDMLSAERWKPGDDPRPVTIPSADGSRPAQRKLKIVPSPKDARDLLFRLISPDTPLVGHGLENDLNSVRIIHPTVVDTVLLYPHKRGLPIRNGLKYLMERFLNRKIQVEDPDNVMQGHDSAEDARAAGELVRLKIKEEWRNKRLEGWTMGTNGSLLAPGESDNDWQVVKSRKGTKAKAKA